MSVVLIVEDDPAILYGLQESLRLEKYDVLCAADGETGYRLAREKKPDLVILELGANDMLRGLDPALTENNLDAMLAELKRRRIPALIAGMRGAPNLDPDYVARFEAIYPQLGRRHGAALYPFFLEGVAAQRGMQQGDGMHPTFAGVKRIVTGIAPAVKRALGRN